MYLIKNNSNTIFDQANSLGINKSISCLKCLFSVPFLLSLYLTLGTKLRHAIFVYTYILCNDVSLKRCEIDGALGTPVLDMCSKINEARAANKWDTSRV